MSGSDAAIGIVDRVIEEARAELSGIIKEAYDSAMKIIDEAERSARAEIERMKAERDREMAMIRMRILGDAEMEVRGRWMRIVEEGVREGIERALDELTDGSLRRVYEDALNGMVEEAVDALGEGEVILACNERDTRLVRSIARRLSKERGMKIKVDREPLNCRGGVVARSPDTGIEYVNTLEERIERAMPIIKRRIAELMRGEG